MNAQDEVRFATAINGLGVTFDKDITESLLDIYTRALEPFSIEQIEQSVNQAILTMTFMPRPAQLIEFIQGSSEDKGEIAWSILQKAYASAGYWDSVMFEDAAITAAIERTFGGWVQCSSFLRVSEDPMIQSKKKEFKVFYRMALIRQPGLTHLPGFHEQNNRSSRSWQGKDGAGFFPGDEEFYLQKLYIASADGGRFIDAKFDKATSALIDSPSLLLEQAQNQKQLPPAKPVQQLPAATAEARTMEPEEIRAQIDGLKEILRMDRPPESPTLCVRCKNPIEENKARYKVTVCTECRALALKSQARRLTEATAISTEENVCKP